MDQLLIKDNDDILKHPIVKGFLKNDENYLLFVKATNEPTKKNIDALDKAFQFFFSLKPGLLSIFRL